MCDSLREAMLDLRSLANGRPGITAAWGTVLAEAATVCLEDQQHSPGVQLRVRGHSNGGCLLEWQNGNDQMRLCYNDSGYTTEHGAYGVAILIAELLTGLTVTERSDKGTHVDFWLGEEDDDSPPFSSEARLEVSGIRRGDDGTIASRLREKMVRLDGIEHPLTAFVIIVEFSSPISEVQQHESH